MMVVVVVVVCGGGGGRYQVSAADALRTNKACGVHIYTHKYIDKHTHTHVMRDKTKKRSRKIYRSTKFQRQTHSQQ